MDDYLTIMSKKYKRQFKNRDEVKAFFRATAVDLKKAMGTEATRCSTTRGHPGADSDQIQDTRPRKR